MSLMNDEINSSLSPKISFQSLAHSRLLLLLILFMFLSISSKLLFLACFCKGLVLLFFIYRINYYLRLSITKSNETKLLGNIYYYDYPTYKGVLIFAHGLGVGHLQYTHEINHFAKLGFKVVTYDNTGSAKSDGEATGGLPQGIMDLKSCLDFVRSRDDLKNYNNSKKYSKIPLDKLTQGG